MQVPHNPLSDCFAQGFSFGLLGFCCGAFYRTFPLSPTQQSFIPRLLRQIRTQRTSIVREGKALGGSLAVFSALHCGVSLHREGLNWWIAAAGASLSFSAVKRHRPLKAAGMMAGLSAVFYAVEYYDSKDDSME